MFQVHDVEEHGTAVISKQLTRNKLRPFFAQLRPCLIGMEACEGVGPLTATALVATVGDAHDFADGRQFAAWLGLVQRQYSSGGKARHGRITKRGDRYLRTLLVHGARAVLIRSADRDDAKSQWVQRLRARRGFHKATVALAAKHARIRWAMLARGADYRPDTEPTAAEPTAA